MVCANNLKQLGLGVALYAYDYETRFPAARSWILQDTDESLAWTMLLWPYVGAKDVYKCPSLTDNTDWGSPDFLLNGYAANGVLFNYYREDEDGPGVVGGATTLSISLGRIPEPSNVAMLYDYWHYWAWPWTHGNNGIAYSQPYNGDWYCGGTWGDCPTIDYWDFAVHACPTWKMGPHRDSGYNFLWVDGHVAYGDYLTSRQLGLTPDEFMIPSGEPGYPIIDLALNNHYPYF